MARLRRRLFREVTPDPNLMLALVMGPTRGDGLTDEDLEVGWRCYGDEVMADHRGVGTRPWGWWQFVAREPMPRPRWNSEARRLEDPAAETLRLAELRELSAAELAALRERANEARLRVGTGDEYVSGGALGTSPRAYSADRRDLDLFRRVEAAMRR